MGMIFFLYIVYELLVGLSSATNAEANSDVAGKIKTAQTWTVYSWCTYPVVYLFPMLGIAGPTAVVAIQVGYSLGHHLQVRRWTCDLSDLGGEDENRAGGGFAREQN